MRRRFSLALLAVFVIMAVVISTRRVGSRNQTARRAVSSNAPHDSLARADSAAEVEARHSADTMCFASRIFLPCDPR